jgi:hypothetical protein
MTTYEKCKHCWHFIEPNDETQIPGFAVLKLAEYVHLDNGEKEHDHDAEPSGDKRTLDEWKNAHPELFHMHKDGMIGPNSVHFIPEFATAWGCADNCDTCWYLLSIGEDSAEERLGEEVARAKLRKHIASGHMLLSEEC